MAAAVVAGGLMLVPAMLATANGKYTIPLSASLAEAGMLPSPGDLLAAVRRAQAKPEDYGASGNLPEADTLSPELLAALAGPAAGDGGIFGRLNTGAGPLASVPPGPLGIPGVMLDAYVRAEQSLAVSHPNCGVHWSVLASIGRIESGHARGGAVDAQGTTVRPILGPPLNGGPGIAAIPDSDGGALDGDRVWDRAVGPMQFIPTTWARYATDGNNDGTANPHNVYDATVSAGRYLCSGGGNLRDPIALAQAVFRYNHSDAYVANVLNWAAAYASGVTPIPSSPAPTEPVGNQPPLASPPPDGVPGGTAPPPTHAPPSTTTGATTPTTTTPTTPTCPTTPTSPPTSSETTTTPPPATCETTTPPSSSSASSTSSSSSTVTQSPAESSTEQSSVSQSPAEPTSTESSTSSAETGTSSSAESPADTTTSSLPPA